MNKSITLTLLAMLMVNSVQAAQEPLTIISSVPANDTQLWVDGEAVPTNLASIKLSVDGTVAVANDATTEQITLDYNPYVETVCKASISADKVVINATDGKTTITLPLSTDPINDFGIYTLTIPAGVLTLNGEPVGKTTLYYYVERFIIDPNFPIDLEPLQGDVDLLQQITFYVDTTDKTYRSIEIGYSWKADFKAFAYVNGEKINLTGKSGDNIKEKYSWASLTFPMPITEPADVEVFIPADYLKYQNKEWNYRGNPAITLKYTVAGGVGAAATEINRTDGRPISIYSIDGCIVKQTADLSEITSLPAGLYIANGKKYSVK